MSWPPDNDAPPPMPQQPDGTMGYSPLVKLAMRMGWLGNMRTGFTSSGAAPLWPEIIKPFEWVAAVERRDQNKVFIFGLVNGKQIMCDDDYYLFPSDRLIGQLKTLT